VLIQENAYSCLTTVQSNCQPRLFINATNVHSGGGKSLLNEILVRTGRGIECIAFLDERMEIAGNVSPNLKIRRVSPSLAHRLLAEWSLARMVRPGDIVLCFGNLPPLFKSRGHVVVFLQNRYLIDGVPLDNLPLKTRCRLSVERFWLLSKMANAQAYFVQTPSMKNLFEALARGRAPVRVLPLMPGQERYRRSVSASGRQEGQEFSFLYVASGEPHKNHRKLIEAWSLMSKSEVRPFLKLTVDQANFGDLCKWMDEEIKKNDLNVKNLGSLSHEQVRALYAEADALIYPSQFESFGLPLIEARIAGLPVLASELDFVRDVLDPEQSFDPASAISIARAVERFMGVEENPLPLVEAEIFLDCVLASAEK
jgi:glycosyltransferase involved in cell wall biosynthesis